MNHGLVYGLAQSLALIPGVSRSGGTIMAGLFMGYTREAAARYSFLLAMPAVYMSGLYKASKVVIGQEQSGHANFRRPGYRLYYVVVRFERSPCYTRPLGRAGRVCL